MVITVNNARSRCAQGVVAQKDNASRRPKFHVSMSEILHAATNNVILAR